MCVERETRSILLLGGASHQVSAIQAANRLGYRTILCDYLTDNPGQEFADTYYPCDTTDWQAVLDIAKQERISGIISFGSDVAAPTAAYVATELGFPTNPLDSTIVLTDKPRFRAFLQEQGYPCPKAVAVHVDDDINEVIDAIHHLKLPLMVKPTDSSGSKGVTVVRSFEESELAQAVAAAKSFSRNGKLVVEERIGSATSPVYGDDIFVKDGKVVFWGVMRCLRDLSCNPLIPVGKMYPPQMSEGVETKVRDLLQSVVTDLDLSFGEMNIEVLVDDDTPYLIELAPRAGGNFIPLELQDISGIDLVEASILCAMGEEPSGTVFDRAPKYVSTSVLHSREAGVLKRIEYPPAYLEHLYKQFVYFEPGDEIPAFSNASRAIGVAFFEFETMDEMNDLMFKASDAIRIVCEEQGDA